MYFLNLWVDKNCIRVMKMMLIAGAGLHRAKKHMIEW